MTDQAKPLRLLKVVVQPTFVREDEDGNLEEIQSTPEVIHAKDWPAYPSKLADLMKEES